MDEGNRNASHRQDALSTAGLERALSPERFGRYLEWANGNRDDAFRLYRLNTRISEALYVPLQTLEIALRNRIHSVMSAAHGDAWFVGPNIVPIEYQSRQMARAVETLAEAGRAATAGRIIASLSFSFWTGMLSPAYEELWRTTLHRIIVDATGRSMPRKSLSRWLTPIRTLRNRIAHHEPILHWNLPAHHTAMRDLIRRLVPEAAEWSDGIDRFDDVYPAAGYALMRRR